MRARPHPLPRTFLLAAAVGALAVVPSSCGKPQAWGEENSLILIADEALWAELEDATYAVLEPTIYTTREEKMFEVTHVASGSRELADLRVFRQVLVFATPDDPLIREAARAAGQEPPLPPGSTFQARDVWARGQVMTALVLDPADPAGSWRRQLPDVLALVDDTFRQRVRTKMFVTGPDTALARDLEARFGFSILVPQVYARVVRGDSIVIIRNDNPDPSQLIRSVLVAWSEPLDSLTAGAAYGWREVVDKVHYNIPQRIDTARATRRHFAVDRHEALEVTGTWQDEGGAVPAGGPFIAWVVQCPDRSFFLDAWLYAPGVPKYEYMLQLREILASFRCAGEGSGGAGQRAGAGERAGAVLPPPEAGP